MEICTIKEKANFSSEKAQRNAIADGEHSKITLWCLEAGQDIHPHAHAGDHSWVVHEGEGKYLTADGEHPIAAGSIIFAPAGEVHGVKADTRLVFVSVSAG